MYDGKVAHGGEGMAMDSYVKGVTIDFDAKAAEGAKVSAPKEAVKSEKSSDKEGEKNLFRIGEDKEPAKSTIDSAISGMNARLIVLTHMTRIPSGLQSRCLMMRLKS